jgi:hypothetical protein
MTWDAVPWDAVGSIATVIGLVAGAINRIVCVASQAPGSRSRCEQ